MFLISVRSSIRSLTEVLENELNAWRAAITALSTSCIDPTLMRPTLSSVAGFITSSVSGFTGSTHLPFI